MPLSRSIVRLQVARPIPLPGTFKPCRRSRARISLPRISVRSLGRYRQWKNANCLRSSAQVLTTSSKVFWSPARLFDARFMFQTVRKRIYGAAVQGGPTAASTAKASRMCMAGTAKQERRLLFGRQGPPLLKCDLAAVLKQRALSVSRLGFKISRITGKKDEPQVPRKAPCSKLIATSKDSPC